MKKVSAIADEILSTCPDLSDSDRAVLRWAIIVALVNDRADINQLIQTRLKVPQYAVSVLIEEIEAMLLSEAANDLSILFNPQSDPSIKSDSLGLG